MPEVTWVQLKEPPWQARVPGHIELSVQYVGHELWDWLVRFDHGEIIEGGCEDSLEEAKAAAEAVAQFRR